MNFRQAVILALSLVLGVNSLLTAENARRIPRRLLGSYQLRIFVTNTSNKRVI